MERIKCIKSCWIDHFYRFLQKGLLNQDFNKLPTRRINNQDFLTDLLHNKGFYLYSEVYIAYKDNMQYYGYVRTLDQFKWLYHVVQQPRTEREKICSTRWLQ